MLKKLLHWLKGGDTVNRSSEDFALRLMVVDAFGQTLDDGKSEAGLTCPFCESNDRSFSVTRKGLEVLYKCHRATCGMAGARLMVPSNLVDQTRVPPVKSPGTVAPPKYTDYKKDLLTIPPVVRDVIYDDWGVTDRHVTRHFLRWANQENSKEAGGRLYVPLYTSTGNRWGAVCRAVDGDTPKVKQYNFDSEVPKVAWFRAHGNTRAYIIVEDVISAIRASDYVNAICILGTDLSPEKVKDINATVPRTAELVLALDADALDKAINYAVTYRSSVQMLVANLRKDIKNMSEEELFRFMRSNFPKMGFTKPCVCSPPVNGAKSYRTFQQALEASRVNAVGGCNDGAKNTGGCTALTVIDGEVVSVH